MLLFAALCLFLAGSIPQYSEAYLLTSKPGHGSTFARHGQHSNVPSLTTLQIQQQQQPTVLFHRKQPQPSNDDDDDDSAGILRFLGKGDRAIVRPGVVLVAPKDEFHHFYRRSAIFIYGMGESLDDYVIRGVIVDHPTVFTLGEMMEHQTSVVNNPLAQNLLFRGGDKGGEGVLLLHSHSSLAEQSEESEEIGDSGIYQGGWQAALQACADGTAKTEDFKVFFNYCEFTENELEHMLDEGGEGDDGWVSLEVDPNIILNSAWDRGDAWTRLRNAMMQKGHLLTKSMPDKQ